MAMRDGKPPTIVTVTTVVNAERALTTLLPKLSDSELSIPNQMLNSYSFVTNA